MIIAFTGNRYGLTEEQKTGIKNILARTDKPVTVLHGDCVGADTDFHNLCSDLEIDIHVFPPDDDKLRGFNQGSVIMRPRPYLKRNEDMIKKCDMLIACPTDKNKEILRSGTWATIRKARKLNKTIHVL
jgi:hypothetical protein